MAIPVFIGLLIYSRYGEKEISIGFFAVVYTTIDVIIVTKYDWMNANISWFLILNIIYLLIMLSILLLHKRSIKNQNVALAILSIIYPIFVTVLSLWLLFSMESLG